MASLASVEQKIFRAAQHIKSLETELVAYFQTHPGKVVRDEDSPTDNPSFRFVLKEPIPARFGLIIGDCLQNLRSSLDYLVWELVLAANNKPNDRNMFPICGKPESFEKAIGESKRLKGVHPDAI